MPRLRGDTIFLGTVRLRWNPGVGVILGTMFWGPWLQAALVMPLKMQIHYGTIQYTIPRRATVVPLVEKDLKKIIYFV